MEVLGLLFLMVGAVALVAPVPAYLLRWFATRTIGNFHDTPAMQVVFCFAGAFLAGVLISFVSSANDDLTPIAAFLLFPFLLGWAALPFWAVYAMRKGLQGPVQQPAMNKAALYSALLGIALLMAGGLTCSLGPSPNFH